MLLWTRQSRFKEERELQRDLSWLKLKVAEDDLDRCIKRGKPWTIMCCVYQLLFIFPGNLFI